MAKATCTTFSTNAPHMPMHQDSDIRIQNSRGQEVGVGGGVLWSPSLTVVVARQQYGRRHSLAQESRTRSSSLEHRSLITAFACRSLLSLEDESVLESDLTVVSECLESNNKTKSYNMVSD